MNHDLLKTYAQDPAIADIADATEAANAINALTYEKVTETPLPRQTVKSWLIEIGKLMQIMAATDELGMTIKFVLTDMDYSEIPIFDTLTQDLFDKCVLSGLFTQAQRAQLESKARITETRPVYELLGRECDFADIERVRAEIQAENGAEADDNTEVN